MMVISERDFMLAIAVAWVLGVIVGVAGMFIWAIANTEKDDEEDIQRKRILNKIEDQVDEKNKK